MRQLLGRAAMLLCATAVGVFGPAAVAQAAQAGAVSDAITVTFADECGDYVAVTVTNTSESAVAYQLSVEDVDATAFSVGAGATRIHHWPTYHGKLVVVTSAGLAGAKSHDHVEPKGCHAPDLKFDGALSCQGLVVLAGNEGTAAAEVRITRNGTAVGDLLEIPAGTSVNRFVPMSNGDVINLQRLTADPDPQWVTILDGEFELDAACGRLPRVEITDTCTGVHVKTVNTFQVSLVLETGGIPPKGPESTEHTVAAGATFEQDLTVADGVLVGASWKQGEEGQVLTTVVKHSRLNNCGGLPVTGAKVGLAAGAGVLLALGGAAIFILTRRRRRED